MWLLKLLAVFIQISALLALGHPECGKLAGKRGGTGGTAHSTGEKASAQTHAWSVAIVIEQDGGSKIHCSGSIIDEKTVLTAAHCFVNPDDPGSVDTDKMKIIVGSNKPTDEESLKKRKRLVQKKKIDNVKVHRKFDKQTIAAYYDVAVVTIKGKFRFRETIWPICLPDKAELDQNAYEDIGMVLAAYGPYAEEKGGLGEVLTSESFTGQNDKFCSAIYSLQSFEAEYEQVENDLPRKFNDDSIFCAKVPGSSSGTCPGDSGGPLFTIKFVPELLDRRAIQRAVVRGSIKPCDGERFPSIFVRLDNYEVLKWIMETVFPDEPPIEDPSKIVVQGPRGPAGPKDGSVSTKTFNETQCARRATSSINSPCLVWETEEDKQTKGPREKAGGGECIYNCEPNDGMFCRVVFEKALFSGATKGLCFLNKACFGTPDACVDCKERCEGYVAGGSPAPAPAPPRPRAPAPTRAPAPDTSEVDLSNIGARGDEIGTDFEDDYEDPTRKPPCTTKDGKKCQFPFIYQGEKYEACPEDPEDPNETWCSTRTNRDGEHVGGGGHYGFCGDNCAIIR